MLHHMMDDLHPPGQNSPDIPISPLTDVFHTPIPKSERPEMGNRMSGFETKILPVSPSVKHVLAYSVIRPQRAVHAETATC